MDLEDLIYFLEEQKSSINTNKFNEKIDCVKDAIIRGNKFEKMWDKFNTQYSHLQLFPYGSTMGPNTVALAMNRLLTEFLGSRPKTRTEKFTDIIQSVYNCYIYKEEKHNKERDAIIKSLVELRDEEENV